MSNRNSTVRRSSILIQGVLLVLVSACGAPKSSPSQTIISTSSDPEETSPIVDEKNAPSPNAPAQSAQPEEVAARMIEDGRTAASLLLKVACKDTSDTGTLAAVYARRVGFIPDADCEKEALVRGTVSPSVLIRALSWRRLIERVDIPIQAASNLDEEDPAVQVLAALAHSVRNLALTSELSSALSLPVKTHCNIDNTAEVKQRSEDLRAAARPFDDGPLAEAVAFEESVYEESCEIGGGELIPSAARLRRSLFSSLHLGDEKTAASFSKGIPLRNKTSLDESLDNRLVKHPDDVLTDISLRADPLLRIEALRAVIIKGGAPSAGRLAAAAAALQSDNLNLGIEGARSFLLFVRQVSK
jgi:hypothetical protein